MPTITLNKKILMKNIGKKLSDDKLKHYISYLGTDLDSIDSKEIVVEVFPNRPDLLSEQGFSRALSTFVGHKKGLTNYKVEKSGEKVIIEDSVKTVRPFTACAIVKGLKLNNDKIIELINIQEKLHLTFGRNRKRVAIGIYPLEQIKMPIYFRALPPTEVRFKPLEYPDELGGNAILEKHPAGKEYGHLLSGEKTYPLFVDDEDNVLSMPPIINSHEVGRITEKTKDAFIECSGHNLRVQEEALNMLVTTMADLGGKIYSMELKYGNKKVVTPNLNPKKMKLNIDYVNQKLGLELKEKDLKSLLEKMGFGYSNKEVSIPAYRTDIIHPIDFVEDIAIAYGYDNFKEEIPEVATIGSESKLAIFTNKLRDLMMGNSLQEVKNYTLSNKLDQSEKMDAKIELVEVANSLSEEYNVMRGWIIPCLLRTLSENKHHEYPQNLFETGTVFKMDNSDTGVCEAERLAVGLCNESADYTKVKQILETVFEAIGISASYEETKHDSFIPGRVARVKVKGKGVAYVGEIHPKVLERFGIEMPLAVFELNLSDLLEVIS